MTEQETHQQMTKQVWQDRRHIGQDKSLFWQERRQKWQDKQQAGGHNGWWWGRFGFVSGQPEKKTPFHSSIWLLVAVELLLGLSDQCNLQYCIFLAKFWSFSLFWCRCTFSCVVKCGNDTLLESISWTINEGLLKICIIKVKPDCWYSAPIEICT